MVEPHTLRGDFLSSGRGSRCSSISESALKAFEGEDIDGGGGGGVWEDGGRGFFFFFLSFLYMRVGFWKKGEQEGIRRRELRKRTTHHLRFGGGGGRG